MSKCIFITGSNSGIGFATAKAFLDQGHTVIASMRSLQNKAALQAYSTNAPGTLHLVQLDVTDPASIQEAAAFTHSVGKIDVLINNAGCCQGGFTGDISEDEWRQQMVTNVDGVMYVTQAFLPQMNTPAHIINISSVSGMLGFPGLSPYCASKFALEGMSESMRLELYPKKQYVSLVQAASFKTNIWDKGLEKIRGMDATAEQQAVIDYALQSAESAGDPVEIAQLITRIAASNKPKFRYPIGKGARPLAIAKRLLPWSLLERIILKQLARK